MCFTKCGFRRYYDHNLCGPDVFYYNHLSNSHIIFCFLRRVVRILIGTPPLSKENTMTCFMTLLFICESGKSMKFNEVREKKGTEAWRLYMETYRRPTTSN